MPMLISKAKTTKGNEYVRMHSSGEVNAADAESMNKTISPGSAMADMAILGLVEPGTSYSPEARQAFTKSGGGTKPVAIVVTGAPLRVMLTFVVRMSGAAANTKFFSNEPDALSWIDERA